MAEREWPDSIGYGSFFIDIHNTAGHGMDTRAHRPRQGFILDPADIARFNADLPPVIAMSDPTPLLPRTA